MILRRDKVIQAAALPLRRRPPPGSVSSSMCRLPRLTLLSRQEQARQRAAAITIQSFWRAVRARHLTTIQRAMFKIRQIQGGASKGE